MSRFAALLLCTALLLAPRLHAQPSGAERQRGPELRAVRILGAEELDEASLRAVLTTAASRCRSPLLALFCALGVEGAIERRYLRDEALAADEERLRALYAMSGFPEAHVRAEVVRRQGGVDVHFLIWEGELLLVRRVEIRGWDELPQSLSLPSLPISPGDRFDLARIETAQRILAGRLAAAGYAFAQVGVAQPPAREGGSMDLVLDVRPGPVAAFGPTQVDASYPLRQGDVLRFLAYRPGERFSTAALERTLERLYRVPLVDRATVQPGPLGDPIADPRVATELTVTTREAEGLQLEGAVSSNACVEGIVGWASRYAGGAPRVLSVSLGASNLFVEPLRPFPCTGAGEDEFAEPDYFARADFSQPLGPDTWLHLGGGFSRESSPRAYVQRGALARISLMHELLRGVDLGAAYSPELRDNPAAAPHFCALHGVCAGEDLAEALAARIIAPFELSLAVGPPRARRIDPAAPLAAEWIYPALPDWSYAARMTASAAAAGTGSQAEYGRLITEASVTRYPGRLFQFVGRVRAGWLTGTGPLPPQLRLFGGGPAGVRGVAANLLGPKVLTVSRARVNQLGCEAVPEGCHGVVADPEIVRVRAIGGATVVESSVEARMWASPTIQVALFADWGSVRSRAGGDGPARLAAGESLLTPGAGFLALTPLGPFRVDVAFDPSPTRRYPLLTRAEIGPDQIYLGEAIYNPYDHGNPGPWEALGRRLQFQLSMRQPF